jgi:hypothetical protein
MSPILIAVVVLGGGASALRRRRPHQDLIVPRPYNNQHSDATAARDEHRLFS